MMSAKRKPMELPARPDIFCYHDYVDFLKDWFAYRKASQFGFSLRQIAKRAGLASGYLPMVLSRKRPLSRQALNKLLPLLNLPLNEISFLEKLVALGTSLSNEARMTSLESMQRFPNFKNKNARDHEVYRYLTHWYYVAIRELSTLPDFKMEAEWIQKRLGTFVPLKKIKEALSFLVEHKYIESHPEGTTPPPLKTLDCTGDVYRLALAKFHREVLALALKSIEITPREQREIQGHTFGLNSENFNEAKAIVERAIQEIRDLGAAEKSGDSVYHFEVALFPLTELKKGGQ